MSRRAPWAGFPACSGLALVAAIVFAAAPAPAHAYTISSAIGTGCHEQITADALRAIRQELTTAPPIPADRNEQALIDDVEFAVPSDLDDLGAVTLLLAVRDNDLKG